MGRKDKCCDRYKKKEKYCGGCPIVDTCEDAPRTGPDAERAGNKTGKKAEKPATEKKAKKDERAEKEKKDKKAKKDKKLKKEEKEKKEKKEKKRKKEKLEKQSKERE
ncbi:MAG: hypothetical protein MUF27_14050 [Acidobacteria bacterium]|jgi:hypothetical protein|nr:hypothetical protein [Acidobacteriota bacterium]